MEDDQDEDVNEVDEGQFDDYEDGMDEEFYENELMGEDEEYGDEEQPFGEEEEEEEDFLDSFKDGKIKTYGGNKPQEPQKPQSHEKMQKFNDGHLNTNGKVNEPDLVKNGGPQI